MVSSSADIQLLPASGYPRVRWKNGQGWTREILRVPDCDDWQWRLSIAEIEHDADFSRFPGIDRALVLLSGNGLRLRHADGRVQTLRSAHDVAYFPGEDAITGVLLDGPTTDFNLMWRRGEIEADLAVHRLGDDLSVVPAAGETVVVHVLSGGGRFAGAPQSPVLQPGDTALVRAASTPAAQVFSGEGDLLLIRLRSRVAAEGR